MDTTSWSYSTWRRRVASKGYETIEVENRQSRPPKVEERSRIQTMYYVGRSRD